MIVELNIEKDEVLRIVGPARIEVVEGSVLLVGATYSAGSSIIVHRLRSYALRSLSKSRIKVILGSGGTVEKPEVSDEVIDDWIKVSEIILNDGGGLALIVGPVESGKTTLAAFISNYLMERNMRTCIIEADVGQEDLAVPGSVAMTVPERKFIWQRELSPQAMEFVGCISPVHCQSTVLSAILRILEKARASKPDLIIINTDGWVSNKQAIDFKLEIARWVRPSHVLVLGEIELYNAMRKGVGNLSKVIKVPSPRKVRERDRSERRELRSDAYRRYFTNSRSVTLRLDSISVIGSTVLCGRELSYNELQELCPNIRDVEKLVEFTSLYGNCLNIVYKASEIQKVTQAVCRDEVRSKYFINFISGEDFKGTLVGLYNSEGECVGLGIIEEVNFKDGVIRIRTPSNEEVSQVVFGKVRLLNNYEDIPRVARCGI